MPDQERRGQGDRRLSPRVGGRRASDIPAEYVTVTEFARRYGVGRDTVHKWIGAGILRFYRVETVVRVRNLPPDQHKALLEQLSIRADPSGLQPKL